MASTGMGSGKCDDAAGSDNALCTAHNNDAETCKNTDDGSGSAMCIFISIGRNQLRPIIVPNIPNVIVQHIPEI